MLTSSSFSSSLLLTLTLTLAATATSTATTASVLAGFSQVRSHNHDALTSPPQRDAKWLIFPRQQELHSQSSKGSLRTLEILSPVSFFKDHATALGLDQEAILTKKSEYETNSGAITHQKYQQFVSKIPVFGGDFHLTVGSHEGGICIRFVCSLLYIFAASLMFYTNI